MGTERLSSPLSRRKTEPQSDDDESFVLDMDSDSDFSEETMSSFEEGADQLPPFEPKDPRSKAKYNIFSRLFFLWLEPLFWLGCQRELDYSDLYAHPTEADSDKLLRRFSRYWTIELERRRCGRKARLMVALMKCFSWRLVVQGISILIETAILVCQSIVLGLLTDYFSIEEPGGEDTRNAYLYALALVAMTVSVILMHSHSFLMGQKMSMISRIITTGAIYKKILCLSQVDIAQVSIGHIINLASNDVQRFDPAFPHFPYLWVAPLHLIAFTYLVYQEFGWSVFLASGFLLLQIPLQIGMAKLFVYLRFKSAKLTDKRVRVMNEIISGIRVIKMYAWENAFRKVISSLRKHESFIIFQGALIRACTLANMIVSISIIMWLMMTAYVATGGEPTTRQVFTTLSLLTSLRLSTYFFVLAILGYSEGQVAISRIQNLLELESESGSPNKSIEDFSSIPLENKATEPARRDKGDEPQLREENILSDVDDGGGTDTADPPSLANEEDTRVCMESFSASWSYQSDRKVLHDITFEVNRTNRLLAVVGPVGSGKSTLLQCLLGELKPVSGSMEVRGRLSYVSQEPWMYMGTIRDNILFGMPYDAAWYSKVIEACSLVEDFKQLIDGDLTLVGERGVTLSGGQKARVNLARAVYHDADIFLLDDPLSAVDASVARHIFDNCIRGILSEHIVILVTHQIQFALQADSILVIKEGRQELCGSCDELVAQGADSSFLLGVMKDDDRQGSGCTAKCSESHLASPLTPFAMLHDYKSASSDDQDTDEDACLSPPDSGSSFQRFFIRTETPLPDQHTASPATAHSDVDSSDCDAKSANSSPDFPKFRPGLISQHATRSSADLVHQGAPVVSNCSPDFPKFKPGLLSQDTSTSPDFPKFRPGLLPRQDLAGRTDVASPFQSADTTVSPDFPKFRPGLLSSPNHSSKVQSSDNTNFFPRQSEVVSNPGSPSSGYITPYLKCPLSPLARTSAQARSPHIRSILKPTTAQLTVMPSQQNRTPSSPLRKKVLQHNLFMREGVDSSTTTCHMEEGEIEHTTSPDIPLLVCLPPTPPRVHDSLTGRNDLFECGGMESTTPPLSTGDQPHVHFKSGEFQDSLVLANRMCVQQTPSPQLSSPSSGQSAQPSSISGSPVHSPSCDGRSTPLKVSSVSPASQFNIPNRYRRRKSVTFEGAHVVQRSPSSLTRSQNSPLSPARSKYYKRRKSISIIRHVPEKEPRMHKFTPSPNLPNHIYRKVSLSPIYSHGCKRSPQRTRDHIKVPSPHLPTHVYRNVNYKRRRSVSIVTNDRHKDAYPVQPRHGRRRQSISIMTHHTTKSDHSPPRYKRRKSVSISTHREDEGSAVQTGPELLPEKSQGTSAHKLDDSVTVDDGSVHHERSRHQKRRKSDTVLSQHQIKSRFYKRRTSISDQHPRHLDAPHPVHLPVHIYSHYQQQLPTISQSPNLQRTTPLSPLNYKRRKSITSGGISRNGDGRSWTPLRSPGHLFRRNIPPPLNFGQQRRRKSVLVINRDNHLIPVTSPFVNRISLNAYQRSLPTTPLPRRYARRMSLSSVIMPRPRRRVETDEQIQVTMEAARFDVTSIYSAKSFLSLAPHKITSGNSAQNDSVGDEVVSELSEEEKGEGSISMKLYYKFFKAGGSILLLLATIAIFILGEAGVVVSDWWLSDWADCSTRVDSVNDTSDLRHTCLLSPSQRIGVYTFTTLAAIILNFSRAILFYFICLRASYVLHNRMFSSILRTFVQFFDNNPAGRVLNRFSKDVGFLDDLLPYIFCEYLLLLLRCIAVIATATASNPWVVIPAVVLIAAFLALRWYYLRTSREVKRLEAVARSPVYSHIAITLHGLPMIRSLGQQHVMMEQFHDYQNQHSQGWYLYLVTVRWFGLRIDLLSSIFLIAVAFFSIPVASQLNAGLVGLGLTYVISLADMLQYTIRLSADVENTMVSAERVMGYGRLEPEAELDTSFPYKRPPPSWPEEGKITMEDVAFQYSSELPLVLKNLCFTIQPAEKVGVVGRTGAGKSSLISVLYRLAEPHGLITIDGVDTKAIGLHDLRKKMSIIPQDPVLFSGSMRYNLDPFDEYTDCELWEALEQVQLKWSVEQLEGQLGGEVSEGGSNFSVGQRQLVCLARALLRKNKILVLDEATANVDQRTDEVIQQTIRDKFSDCTVIAIAHRLNTIMDSDKIMLLKNGRLREFDSPYNLLQDTTSKFYKMVEKTGPASSARLHQIAIETHLRKTFGSKATRLAPPSTLNNGVNKVTTLAAKSLLQSSMTSLNRRDSRRPSIVSSNSFPCALNEIGTNAGMNANDPNLQNLRLPSDPTLNVSRSTVCTSLQEDEETEAHTAITEVPYNG